MRHRDKVMTSLAALAATAALAACGSSSEDETAAVSGQLKPVADAPAEYAGVAGEATLERADGGTTVSLSATGLEPKTAYLAHLHAGGCGETDPGGAHFKFDPEGAEEPPNEIHLEFSSGADGSGRASASSNREVPLGEAGSVVLHEAAEEEEHHTTAAVAGGDTALLVHEGHHHGSEDEDRGADDHGEAHSGPAKIACAELEGSSASANAGPTIVIRDGKPVGGIAELEYSAGDQVRFEVESDVADEVHVHGYDLMEDVPAGGTVGFDFAAEIEGIFEIELEGRKEQIAELRVNP